MIVSLFVVPGVAILLVSALAGVFTHYGRKSPELLVAPSRAGFGAASALVRAEATRERARADLASLTTPKTAPALTLVTDRADHTGPRAARSAA
jgi:hypothetical protein